ncbi:SMAD/FHA domain-containing protein, partial [Auriscalpium vulgare]
ESPPLRQTILGSFLRGRPRGTSQSHPSPVHDRDSPPPPIPSSSMFSPPSPVPGSHRRRPAAPVIQTSASHNMPISTGGFTQMLRRRRSGGALATSATPQTPIVAPATMPLPASAPSASSIQQRSSQTHRIRLVPQIDNRRSLRFDPITRDVSEGDTALRIGRFTDRSGLGVAAANALGSNKLAFKSKVVSRAHAEIWCEQPAKFFIRDTKSSSGTFLNHVRLSAANQDSRPFELKDGDTLQLGVDYQGGTEDIYKCVRIRVEIGREWQTTANKFNTNAIRQLKELATPQLPEASDKRPTNTKTGFPDCCICEKGLFSVTIQQALFIAPCSHAFHYKCIRPILELHHPGFSCPLCRTFADLEQDVEVDAASFDLEHDQSGEE